MRYATPALRDHGLSAGFKGNYYIASERFTWAVTPTDDGFGDAPRIKYVMPTLAGFSLSTDWDLPAERSIDVDATARVGTVYRIDNSYGGGGLRLSYCDQTDAGIDCKPAGSGGFSAESLVVGVRWDTADYKFDVQTRVTASAQRVAAPEAEPKNLFLGRIGARISF